MQSIIFLSEGELTEYEEHWTNMNGNVSSFQKTDVIKYFL